MARRPRNDTPGAWHHVLNRALAKRPYFETRSDQRFFLGRLASEVRVGRIEVHAYSLLTTHYHLLVRSPIGELSEAMRRIQNAYSRRFNRLRRRDGPLIRARFFSKPVETDAYRRALVRYIDANAVKARMVTGAAEHEFGSARAYLGDSIPPWLTPDWVAQHAREKAGARDFSAAAYLATFGPREGEDLESLSELVELRMASSATLDPLEDLIGKTPNQVRRWMIRKARLGDGMQIGLPVCGPPAVLRAIEQHVMEHGEWLVDDGASTWRGSQLTRSGLLHDLCSLPFAQIARLSKISTWTATKHVELHRTAVLAGED